MSSNVKSHYEISWIDVLRFIAIVAVITIHSSSSVSQFASKYGFNWWIGNFYDSISRFCVPVFIMISGSLILRKDYLLSEFIRKRVIRIMPPFAFWTIIFITFNIIDKGLYKSAYVFKFIALSIINGAFFHFWFIYTLLGIYLVAPIIRKWLKHAEEKEILYFLIFWLAGLCFNMPFLNKLRIGIVFVNFGAYLGYFVLGYYLSISDVRIKNIRLTGWLTFLCGFLITFLGTGLWSSYKNSANFDLYDYRSINVCLMSAAVFLLCKRTDIKFGKLTKSFIMTISNYTFGIYLFHPLLIIFLERMNIHYSATNPTWGVPLTVIVVLIGSVIVLRLLKSLPFGKYITGAT